MGKHFSKNIAPWSAITVTVSSLRSARRTILKNLPPQSSWMITWQSHLSLTTCWRWLKNTYTARPRRLTFVSILLNKFLDKGIQRGIVHIVIIGPFRVNDQVRTGSAHTLAVGNLLPQALLGCRLRRD